MTMLSHIDFQHVYDFSAGSVVALDIDGLIVYANPKAKQDLFSGITYENRPATSFFKGPEKPLYNDDEFVLPGNAGNKITVLISSAVFTDSTGVSLTYWFIRNITTLKKKEDLLAYLNIATEELSRARDTGAALAQISKLIVPKFATW